MNTDVFGLLSGAKPEAILAYLDDAAYAGLSEVDLENDLLHILYREENKFVGPENDCMFSEIRSYAGNRFVHPEDRDVYLSFTEPSTLAGRFAESTYPGILSAQYRLRTTAGNYRWVEQVMVCGEQFGLPAGIVRVYHFDIQLQKNRRLGLAFSAQGKRKRDELTGLLLGDSFFPAAERMLSVPMDGVRWCMLLISIEHLQLFREWFGRDAGNDLLRSIGAVLRLEADESSGLAAHLWDDDFLLLTPYDRAAVDRLYEKLHAEIKAYGIPVGFLPVIGVCPEEEGCSALVMADRAYLAASALRGNFHTRIGLYRPEMGDRTREEYQLLSEFQQALKTGELSFMLQPQCVADTGKVVGAEALIRWRKADGSSVSPGRFIPVLEKYGFTSEADQFIWRQVCAWLRDWSDRGHDVVPISVNISQTDILTFDVPEYLEGLIREFSLPRELLKLEITESAYVSDVTAVRDAVAKLRSLGYRVLMDDFGSGYSSLSMLSTLGVDVVKLDSRFLHMDEDDRRGRQILEAIVSMTKRLTLPVIVEGVESAEEVSFLSAMGCRYMQGYFYYRPLSVADFEALILDGSMVDRNGVYFCGKQPFLIREFLDQNVFSDAMLNNIIGAVAYYAWDGGEHLDIIRYNDQFRQVVGDSELDNRTSDILSFLPQEDRERMLRLLRRALKDPLNGASGLLNVYRSNGELGRFLLRLFYLEDQGTSVLFYASLQEIIEQPAE